MFRLDYFEGRRVLKSSLMDGCENVHAFFTTRDLPLKAGELLGMVSVVEDNKNLVTDAFKIDKKNLVIPIQTHSDNVAIIKQNIPEVLDDTDAVVTAEPDVAIGLNFADCVPLIFYDTKNSIIAAAHAGWRGTVSQIGVKTILKMKDEFGTNPKDIVGLIGPCIGKCCFEVGQDVVQKLAETIDEKYFSKAFENNYADLKLINKLQLLAIGVEKIDVCEYCTFCQNELFFSYRKEKGNTARHSAIIIKKGRV